MSNTMLLLAARVSLLNGISFHPVASAACTSVTDGRTDYATVTSVAVLGIIFSDVCLRVALGYIYT